MRHHTDAVIGAFSRRIETRISRMFLLFSNVKEPLLQTRKYAPVLMLLTGSVIHSTLCSANPRPIPYVSGG